MSDQVTTEVPTRLPPDSIPRAQRVFDNIFLLLGLGLLVMVVLYTTWGLWEVLTLPQATLP